MKEAKVEEGSASLASSAALPKFSIPSSATLTKFSILSSSALVSWSLSIIVIIEVFSVEVARVEKDPKIVEST